VVETFRPQLIEDIWEITSEEEVDSPVYTFVRALTPPKVNDVGAQVGDQRAEGAAEGRVASAGTQEARNALMQPMRVLIEHALQLREGGNFAEMAAIRENSAA
jgi:hypothetical protein